MEEVWTSKLDLANESKPSVWLLNKYIFNITYGSLFHLIVDSTKLHFQNLARTIHSIFPTLKKGKKEL